MSYGLNRKSTAGVKLYNQLNVISLSDSESSEYSQDSDDSNI